MCSSPPSLSLNSVTMSSMKAGVTTPAFRVPRTAGDLGGFSGTVGLGTVGLGTVAGLYNGDVTVTLVLRNLQARCLSRLRWRSVTSRPA